MPLELKQELHLDFCNPALPCPEESHCLGLMCDLQKKSILEDQEGERIVFKEERYHDSKLKTHGKVGFMRGYYYQLKDSSPNKIMVSHIQDFSFKEKCGVRFCDNKERCDEKKQQCIAVSELDSISEIKELSLSSEWMRAFMLSKKIEGIIVEDDDTTLFIQEIDKEEDAGLYVKLHHLYKHFIELKKGDVIAIKGRVGKFYGRTILQALSKDDVTVISLGGKTPKPVVMDAGKSFHPKYDSMLVDASEISLYVLKIPEIYECTSDESCTDGAPCRHGECSNSLHDLVLTNENQEIIMVQVWNYPHLERAFEVGDSIQKLIGFLSWNYFGVHEFELLDGNSISK